MSKEKSKKELLEENRKLKKMVSALMKRVEKSMDSQGSAFSLFQTNIILEDKIKSRTESLRQAEAELEKTNRSLEKEVRLRTEQYIKAEKMAFIGRQSAEIIHNLKNPLTALLFQFQVLKRKGVDEFYIEKMEGHLQKINNIASSILDSARSTGVGKLREISLNEIIIEELEVLKAGSFVDKDINVELDLKDKCIVKGEAIHFGQIVSNIVGNARDALTHGKNKTISISSYESDDFAIILIKDNGEGISEEVGRKVFEPLFTTKEKKGPIEDPDQPVGTGLGLAFCKRMTELYDGKISFSSRPGQGTEFKLEFPLLKRHKIAS
jgi:signal transduction histidine kinase